MLETLGGRIRESIPVQNQEANRERMIDEARRWFLEPSDCDWWCEAAGYDVEMVRRKAKRIADGRDGLNLGKQRNSIRQDEIEFIIAEKAKGTPNVEIAWKVGRSPAAIGTIYWGLKKSGVVSRP